MNGSKTPAALCSLYFSQGVVYGIAQLLIAWQVAAGASLETQADLIAWGALPWVLKFAWSLVWDRLLRSRADGGRARAATLVLLQLAVAAALAAYGLMGKSPALPLLFFVMNTLLGMQDVGTDAMVVDAIPAERRGKINGAMYGARALGSGLVGTLLFVKVMGSYGLQNTLVAFGLVLGLLAIVVWGSREAPALERPASTWPPLSALVSTRGRRFGLLLALLAINGDALTGAVATDFLMKAGGWEADALFSTLAPAQYTVEVLAYAASMVAITRLGARRVVLLGAFGNALILLGLASVPGLWDSQDFVLAYALVEVTLRSLMYAGIYTVLMGHTERERRATHFMIYMTLMNLARLGGTELAPSVFDVGGYAGVYYLAAVLIAAVGVVAFVWRDADEAEDNPA